MLCAPLAVPLTDHTAGDPAAPRAAWKSHRFT
jgi:hypothetical protein